MPFPSESGMMSKELQNSDLIYVNLMTDVFKIIFGKLSPNIAIYRLVGTELTGHNPSFTLFLICYFFTHSKVLCPYKVCSLFKNKVYNKALQLFFEKQFFSQNNQWLNNILNSQFIVV